ncbi:hypothetical protein MTO96_000068 [Rhipicephalus appendiculatus]
MRSPATPSCIAAVEWGARALNPAHFSGLRERTPHREETEGDVTGEVFLIRRRFGTETHRGIGERHECSAAAWSLPTDALLQEADGDERTALKYAGTTTRTRVPHWARNGYR